MKPLLLFFLLMTAGPLAAQCYVPQPLADRMADADLMVVGTVTASNPFYNAFGEIYTMHTLSVDRSNAPNGATGPSSYEFFTMGGRINEEQTIVYPSLRGIELADGMFLLKAYTGNRVVAAPGQTLYRPVAMHESFLGYNSESGRFSDGGAEVGDLQDLDEMIAATTGTRLRALTDRAFVPRGRPRSNLMGIDGISPRNVNAGVGDVIAIDGSGFGNSPGTIFFDSPDDGFGGSFVSAPEAAILSWSDSRVRVRVISEAGSGSVIVRTAGGDQLTSDQEINVDYAVTNLALGTGAVEIPRLVDDEADGDGGYAFAVSNSSANGGRSLADDPAARAALNRAVSSWQQNGDFNIRLRGTTPVQESGSDGVNVISFGSNAYDFDRELGRGTLGIAFSYYGACGASAFEVVGADVLFRRPGNGVNYNFGPGGGAGADFESVALHELGHVHQLKHVADAGEVMSFRITNGATQRTVSPDTRAGADAVTAIAENYDPPIVNCDQGDLRFERAYQSFSDAGGILPVSWVAFTATLRGKVAELSWVTDQEPDNDFFTVERSTDGRTFLPLAVVAAAGGATNGGRYAHTDRQPSAGLNYYRIRQTDLDGSSSFSDVREVVLTGAAGWSVFPNPVVNRLHVRGGEQTAYEILDAGGRLLFSLPAGAGNSAAGIDVSRLRRGHYFLRAADGSVRRFVR